MSDAIFEVARADGPECCVAHPGCNPLSRENDLILESEPASPPPYHPAPLLVAGVNEGDALGYGGLTGNVDAGAAGAEIDDDAVDRRDARIDDDRAARGNQPAGA